MYNISELVIGVLVYLILFIIPIFSYLKFKSRVNPLIYLKLLGNFKQGILIGIIISSIFIILLFYKNENNTFILNKLDIGILWVSGLLVGFFEEIPFRGFLLQKLDDNMKFWKANLLTTLIFTLFHIPTWLINFNGDIIQSVINISIVSFVLGYLFKEYNSLWIPIICHSVFNLCIWMKI